MIWFVVGLLVLLVGGAAVLFVVLHATSEDEESAPFSGGDDGTPTGDTAQHAGEQTSDGETVAGQDAAASGGSGTPFSGDGSGDGDGSDNEPSRQPGEHESGVVGGEAEGESTVQTGELPKPRT